MPRRLLFHLSAGLAARSEWMSAVLQPIGGRWRLCFWLVAATSFVLLPIGSVAEDTADPASARLVHKLRVEDAALSRELQQKGTRLIGDYGSYQLLEVPPATAKELSRHPQVTVRDDFDVIELHARRIHTGSPEVQATRRAVADFSGNRLHLVHFAGPIRPEWHAELHGHGVQIVSYLPHNAYLVYGDVHALRRLQAAAHAARHVQWEGEFLDAYKIHSRARPVDEKGQARKLADNLFAIQLMVDPAANAETLRIIDGLKRQPVLKQEKVLNYLNVLVRVPPERLVELAARPDVVSLRPYVMPQKRDERQDQILAGNLSGPGPSGPGYLAWLASKGFTQAQFTASGFVVDVSDSGLDNASSTPGHFGLYVSGNLGLASRVVYNRLVGTPNTGSTLQGCDGHGTLNAHVIAGYNDQSGFPFTDVEGFSYGLGVAPFVRVGSSVVFDPDTFTSPNYADLQSQAYADGARISANSWGANTAGDYDIDAQAYDVLVRDSQPAGAAVSAPGNQQMVIVFAAGNAGPGSGSVGTPGSAKNVLCVGATENVHPHSSANGGNNVAGNDGCNKDDTESDNASDLATFSSRGPCADGRAKPDLAAPGTHVTGGVAQQTNPGPAGSALACFGGTGVCALPGGGSAGSASNFFPLGQQFYTTSSGTSHSTPAVAVGAALLRQYFINRGWLPPSPAMTKAWLMNTTRYLDGAGANDTLPSNHQGLGSMDLGMAFDGVSRYQRDQLAPDKFTASGQARHYVGTITDTNRPLRVTLAWTDAPGSTTGNAYNNDLDLTMTLGGVLYRGNVFIGALSVPGGAADPRNNVESVFLPAGMGGNFVVAVTAANINSDGVPNDADLLDQDFALVIYNAHPNNAPVLAAAGFALGSENCSPGNGAVDPGETVVVNLALSNVGTASTTNLVATLLASDGVTAPSGPQHYGVLVDGGSTVARAFSFSANGPCGGTGQAVLQLRDGGADLGNVVFPFPLGTANSNSIAFTQSNSVAIPASGSSGAASPYPSSLSVSGVIGTVSKVTVTLSGLSHTYPSDLDVLLAGPSGQTVMLMSSVGGGADVNGVTLTFDDAAPSGVLSPITSGTFRPTAAGNFTLPAPAPAGPYGSALAVFNGANPNGLWRLFINDHASSDIGFLAGGWTLTVITTEAVCCLDPSAADLALHVTDTPDPVAQDGQLTFMSFVTNRGPAAAAGIFLTNVLPLSATFVSATPSQGSCVFTDGKVICSLGVVASHTVATMAITVAATSLGKLTNIAIVAASTADYSTADNAATNLTTVVQPRLDIAGAIVNEGNSGTTNAVFAVSLAPPSTRTVAVDFTTADGTAQAGSDYLATNGVLSFAPGVTNLFVVVPVLGDTVIEPNETFSVTLSSPANAVLGDTMGTGLILNDDLAVATLPFTEDWESGTFRPVWVVAGTGPNQAQVTSLNGTHGGAYHLTLDSAGGYARNEVTLAVNLEGYTNVVLRFWAVGYADDPHGPPPLPFTGGADFDGVAISVDGMTWYEVQGLRSLSSSYSPYVVDLDAAMTANRLTYNSTFRIRFNQYDNYPIPIDGIGIDDITLTGQAPGIVPSGSTVVSEGCIPPNGLIDPAEMVTVNLTLRNTSAVATTNLVATLLEGGGVTAPSGPQTFGVLLPGGLAITRAFTFTAEGACGGSVLATLQLQDGTADLGTATFTFRFGRELLTLAEYFDAAIVPALPHDWTAQWSGAGTPWRTDSGFSDTAPNSAFAPDPDGSSDNRLTSPSFHISALPAQASFRHRFSTEACCDGGRLEISIGGGSFTEILSAGGSFQAGGYNAEGQWAGDSGGFMTTLVNLPDSVFEQNVQLRWHFTSDSSVGDLGWFVDSLQVTGQFICCQPDDVSLTMTGPSRPVLLGTNLAYTITVGNSGPSEATGVTVNSLLPPSAMVATANASQGSCVQNSGLVVCDLGSLAGAASATIVLGVVPTDYGALTNIAIVTRNEYDPVSANNTATHITRVDGITSQHNFATPGSISIPDFGKATPYPSTLSVSGIAAAVVKATVTLSNLSHSYPDDLDVLVVGPHGQKAMLMSDVGGNIGIQNVTLTLDDGAAVALQDSAEITAGTFRPTDYSIGDTFPAPAPSGPYGTALSVFNDVDPNGSWRLLVYDDSASDSGSIANGWSVRITTRQAPDPVILNPGFNGEWFQFYFLALAGRNYVVEYKDALDAADWQSLQWLPGDGAVQWITDYTAGLSGRFYRVRVE